MKVNQYGQIYFKTMVKFVIDNSVQFETILYSLGCLSVNASVTSNRIKLHHSPFYTMALSVRQLLFDVIVIINSITQNYLIVHLIMQVIFKQQLFVTLS